MNTNLHGYAPYAVDDTLWMLDLSTHAITSGVVKVIHNTSGVYSYDVLVDGTSTTVTVAHADAYALKSYAELKLQLIVTPTPTSSPTNTPPVTRTPHASPTPSVTVSNTVPFGPDVLDINGGTWTLSHATITNGKIVSSSTDGVAPVSASIAVTVPVNRQVIFTLGYNEGTVSSAKLTLTGNSTGVVQQQTLLGSGKVDVVLFTGANTSLTLKVELFEDATFKKYALAGYTYLLTDGVIKVVAPTTTVTPSPTATLTPTPSPSATRSVTPTPSATKTATPSPTASATISVTPSVTASAGVPVTPTPSPTHSAAVSVTPSPTVSGTPAVTHTVTPSPTVTATHSVGVSPSPTPTISSSAGLVSPTPTPTATVSGTPVVTPTPSVTATH